MTFMPVSLGHPRGRRNPACYAPRSRLEASLMRSSRIVSIVLLTAFAGACTGLLGDYTVTDGSDPSAPGADGSVEGATSSGGETGTGSETGGPKKPAGSDCTQSDECLGGLSCLDAVCCLSFVCGPCSNCGRDGTCSVKIGSAAGTPDPMPNGCDGTSSCNASNQCKKVLGQICTAGNECVSGNCVDGRCCGDATCPACRNCGATGACDVVVGTADGKDDPTPTACKADSMCNASGVCKARWSLVGTDAGLQFGGAAYAIGMGNFLYYATENNSGVAAQFFRSFDVTTSALASQGLVSNDLCACGYEGTLVAANGQLHYIANSARSYSPNKSPLAAWVDHASYTNPTNRSRGEAAYAVSGNLVYGVGGRGNLLTAQTYNVATDTWAAIASTPAGTNQACAASYGGKVYVFGGQTSKMYAYDEANPGAGWTTLPDITFGCSAHTGQVWQGKIVIGAGTSVQVFNPATALWETPIPLPASGAKWEVMVAGAPDGLYAVGNVGADLGIFKYVF
jgi:hypothetical protein